jgi:carbon monoxide dehydrogenase subunit G
MELTGEVRIAAPRESVWQALNAKPWKSRRRPSGMFGYSSKPGQYERVSSEK